jgi:5'-3' exoribonuclease 2
VVNQQYPFPKTLQVFDKFKAYKALVENQTGMKIKTLRSDNGVEFVSKKFDNFLHECGIQ